MVLQEAVELSPRPEAERVVVGIWLIAITSYRKVFVVENQFAKFESQKVPGQLNCPAETYKPTDGGNFRNTLDRAIEEEIGIINCNPSNIKPLGFVKLAGLGKGVIAAPYLIPVTSEADVQYNPKDQGESSNPRWVNLSEIESQKTLTIGRFNVPLYRTPMVEIAELVSSFRRGKKLKVLTAKAPVIGKDVYDFLEQNTGTRPVSIESHRDGRV